MFMKCYLLKIKILLICVFIDNMITDNEITVDKDSTHNSWQQSIIPLRFTKQGEFNLVCFNSKRLREEVGGDNY